MIKNDTNTIIKNVFGDVVGMHSQGGAKNTLMSLWLLPVFLWTILGLTILPIKLALTSDYGWIFAAILIIGIIVMSVGVNCSESFRAKFVSIITKAVRLINPTYNMSTEEMSNYMDNNKDKTSGYTKTTIDIDNFTIMSIDKFKKMLLSMMFTQDVYNALNTDLEKEEKELNDVFELLNNKAYFSDDTAKRDEISNRWEELQYDHNEKVKHLYAVYAAFLKTKKTAIRVYQLNLEEEVKKDDSLYGCDEEPKATNVPHFETFKDAEGNEYTFLVKPDGTKELLTKK